MNSPDQMETEFVFDPREPFFEGHFPGCPVTPGVMLIDKAVSAAEKMLGREIVPKSIRKVRFSNPVRPGKTVKLRLDRLGEEEIAYLFSGNGIRCASGVILFS